MRERIETSRHWLVLLASLSVVLGACAAETQMAERGYQPLTAASVPGAAGSAADGDGSTDPEAASDDADSTPDSRDDDAPSDDCVESTSTSDSVSNPDSVSTNDGIDDDADGEIDEDSESDTLDSESSDVGCGTPDQPPAEDAPAGNPI